MSRVKCERDQDIGEVSHAVYLVWERIITYHGEVSHAVDLVWDRIITYLREVSHVVDVQELRHQLVLAITHCFHLFVLPM